MAAKAVNSHFDDFVSCYDEYKTYFVKVFSTFPQYADDIIRIAGTYGDDVIEAISNSANVENAISLVSEFGDDGAKVVKWKYAPECDIYAKYKDVFDNENYYNQSTGAIKWPGQNGDVNTDGFVNGKYEEITLLPGERIDRYGKASGNYVSPEGVPYEQRALHPGTKETEDYSVYIVNKPIEVRSGEIAPWFDEPGGGTQFKLPKSVSELIDEGVLEKVV